MLATSSPEMLASLHPVDVQPFLSWVPASVRLGTARFANIRQCEHVWIPAMLNGPRLETTYEAQQRTMTRSSDPVTSSEAFSHRVFRIRDVRRATRLPDLQAITNCQALQRWVSAWCTNCLAALAS